MPKPTWDHDHCDFCWAKFMEPGNSDALHEGYYSESEDTWPSTIIGYETQLGKWISPKWADLELEQITKMKVYDTLFEEVDQKLSPWTLKTLLKMARRIFEMAVVDGLIHRNPCAGIQITVPEVEQKFLTSLGVGIFLQEAKLVNHKFYPVWALALMTGMRSGELFALKWTDIDLERKTIAVTKQWTNKNGINPTKTRRSRVVPISADLPEILTEQRLKFGSERETVLPRLAEWQNGRMAEWQNGRMAEWQNGEQARVTREFCACLGITEVNFHDLRATFITSLLARGESRARVMSMVGHSQIKTTNGYLKKAGVDVQGGSDKLGYKLPEGWEVAKVLSLVQN